MNLTLRWKDLALEKKLSEESLSVKGDFPKTFDEGTIIDYEDTETEGLTGSYEIEKVRLQIVNHGIFWSSEYIVDLKKVEYLNKADIVEFI